jgi:hypothetical protein
MVSMVLMTLWGTLDFFLLASGGVMIAFSILWKAPDVFRNLVLTEMDLTVGMVLGILYAVTFIISVGAIIQRNHITIGLVMLNWLLIFNTAFTVVFASVLWFRTLEEQVNFEKVWIAAPAQSRLALQDQWKCCGYRNSTNMEIGGAVCSTLEVANATVGCMDQFTNDADNLLNETFTTIWGFTAVTSCLFISTLCVIKKREETERFRKIDSKRGGRGFV